MASNPEEPSKYYDDEWHFTPGGYVPPEDGTDLKPIAPESVDQRDPKELLRELNKIAEASAMLRPNSEYFMRALTLLNYYKGQNRLEWKTPKSPFPSYDHMTPTGRALWLYMLIAANNDDNYAVTPGEFNDAIEPFLTEFFPDTNGDRSNLNHEQKAALSSQLGIGDHLLGHSSSFRQNYENTPGIRFFEQE